MNHGNETSTETAGTRRIGIVVETEGSVLDVVPPLGVPVDPEAPLAPLAPVAGVAGVVVASGVLAATAAQPVPGLTPLRTFDQTTELSVNERLEASSNS